MKIVLVAFRLVVSGQVQGVGFRPFVYRLAKKCGLAGQVQNSSTGVVIDVEGQGIDIRRFQQELMASPPAGARIEAIRAVKRSLLNAKDFLIVESKGEASAKVRVPPDLGTCSQCLREVVARTDRRCGYPFTNCVACGPRFSILDALPYDRPVTAMRLFPMCRACEEEYATPANRRFHAQPNACPDCGPQISLCDRTGQIIAGPNDAIRVSARWIEQGMIVALKGLGGFQLLVRADQADAVQRLRERKGRPTKPFAVMVAQLADAEQFGRLDIPERNLLQSPHNPIVLVQKRIATVVADEVAPGVDTIGLFLPTTPLHHLLLAELEFPVVATSGNRSNEPIVTKEQEVIHKLAQVADAFLIHNRPIVHRVDDSVVRVIAGKPCIMRLARGYTPLPLPALEKMGKQLGCSPMIALGGHQKNAVALWTGEQAILSQHLGDMDGLETRSAFEHLLAKLCDLYGIEPKTLACDLHPEFFTTRWAESQALPFIQVQHHHAHAVACMAEHDLLDRDVLAITWDGTGFGSDGTLWGGEFLVATRSDFQRVVSLRSFPLLGGEKAIQEPRRIALAVLCETFGTESVLKNQIWPSRLGFSKTESRILLSMIEHSVNTPWTSSMGRMFDAVAALVLGIHKVSYEGEAAVLLEATADENETGHYPLSIQTDESQVARGDWHPMVFGILNDVEHAVEPSIIAARFHNTLAQWVAQVVSQFPQPDIVLSGGCFQNRLLTERIIAVLRNSDRKLYWHSEVPPGDGGLAVGQLAVAMSNSVVQSETAQVRSCHVPRGPGSCR